MKGESPERVRRERERENVFFFFLLAPNLPSYDSRDFAFLRREGSCARARERNTRLIFH